MEQNNTAESAGWVCQLLPEVNDGERNEAVPLQYRPLTEVRNLQPEAITHVMTLQPQQQQSLVQERSNPAGIVMPAPAIKRDVHRAIGMALFVTICCCFPLGIAALFVAGTVKTELLPHPESAQRSRYIPTQLK